MRTTAILLCTAWLGACGGKDGPEPTDTQPPGQSSDADIREMQLGVTTGADGSSYVDFDVEAGETDMLITVSVDDLQNNAYIDEVIDPDGTLVWDGDEQYWSDYSLSYAGWPDIVTSLNWPILASHGPLKEGRWTFRFTTVDPQQWRPLGDVKIAVHGQFSNDSGFDSGGVEVHVIYTGGTDQDPVVTEAVDASFELWGEMYRQVGVEPSFATSVYPGNVDLSPPSLGSFAEYEELMAANDVGVVNLVLVPEFSGQGGASTLGLAGGIPGPLAPTPYSAVAVNVAAHMGSDLQFTPEEARILAETMAHEVGHYLGLFHPVEDGWQWYDAIDDTPECGNMNDCQNVLGSNLMFPYTVCGGGECVAQANLTTGQGDVLHRYVGVY